MKAKDLELIITKNLILGFLKPKAEDDVLELLKKYRPELFGKSNDQEDDTTGNQEEAGN